MTEEAQMMMLEGDYGLLHLAREYLTAEAAMKPEAADELLRAIVKGARETGELEPLCDAVRAFDEIAAQAPREYARTAPTEWEARRDRVIAEARNLVGGVTDEHT